MGDQMEFPETFEEFAKEYGFKDDKEVYTNGSDLIPVFRVKQWLEHVNKNGWIPISSGKLPEIHQDVLLSLRNLDVEVGFRGETEPYYYCNGYYVEPKNVLAWQPKPESYDPESEGKDI